MPGTMSRPRAAIRTGSAGSSRKLRDAGAWSSRYRTALDGFAAIISDLKAL